MYAMGDFEYALVFYHRGDKIRPDIKAFKLGIQKAQEAINNSIGCECRAMYCTGISALSCAQEGFHMFSSKCKVQSRLLYIHTVMVHTHNILQRKLSQMILKPILFSSLLSPLCFSSCCLQAGQDGRPLFLSTAGHDCMSYSTPCCILCFENLAIIAHCDPKPCHHVSDRM